MTFVLTEDAKRAEIAKRRKRERDRQGDEPAGADEQAMGAMDAAECEPGMAGKSYGDIGAVEGPGHPVTPGEIDAEDHTRPYLAEGHAAEAPGNAVTSDGTPAPGSRHVDLTGSRGTLTALDPHSPFLPGGVR